MPSPMDKRLKAITVLPKKMRENLKPAQVECVLRYTNQEKLLAVHNWSARKAAARIETREIARQVKKPPSRISEYLNFKHEPEDFIFAKIELVLSRLEG